MTRLLKNYGMALALATLAAGCTEASTKSYDGQVCTTNGNSSIQYTCDRTFSNLICISTYQVAGTESYVCRVACNNHSDCPIAGDVCCSGKAVSNAFNATKGCTPRNRCETDPIALLPSDAGATDAGGGNDSGSPAPDAAEPSPDTGATDTAADDANANDASGDL